MGIEYNYNLWPEIQGHAWKWRPRTKEIVLIQIHATRSGQTRHSSGRLWNMDDERKSSSWWFTSEDNKVPGAPHEAAMCNILIGNGTITKVLPDSIACHHSLGHADASGLSLEICQPLNNVPFLEVDLRLAAEVVADWSQMYNVPIKVLSYLSYDNHEGPGEIRHDRSAQGKQVGKTDPGDLFPTDEEWVQMVRGGNMATAAQNRERLNYQAVLLKLAGIAAAGGKAEKIEADWGVVVSNALRKEQ